MDEIADVARRRFGLPQLRPGQREGISALVAGRDALVLMPTGGGKSAVYEIAGAIRGGLTVVISPLVALQRDQVDGIADKPDAPPAVLVNSTLRADERRFFERDGYKVVSRALAEEHRLLRPVAE